MKSKHMKRTRLDDLILRDKHTKTLGAMVLLLALLLIWQAVEFLVPAQIIVVETSMDGSTSNTYLTRARYARGALDELGIEVSDIDDVSPVDGYVLRSGDTVEITRCIPTRAVIAGSERDFVLRPGSVADNLAFNGIAYDDDDIISPALDTTVTPKVKIEFKDVRKEVEEKQEVVPARNVVILDPDLYSGTVEETEGVDGEAIFTYTTTYVNGQEQGTEKVVKEWITDKVDHKLRCGTSLTGESGETTYTDTFISESTAYYFGEHAYGSTGTHCTYGTCAVDPTVIPYGTTLYVEDYGIAVANDTGGAIVGTDIDLYMYNENDARRWGRYNVRVWVLDY